MTYPFSLLLEFGDTVISLSTETDPKICYVDFKFNVKGVEYKLLDEGCYHLNDILTYHDMFSYVYYFYILFVKFILVGFFVNLCIKKWNSIFNKGG